MGLKGAAHEKIVPQDIARILGCRQRALSATVKLIMHFFAYMGAILLANQPNTLASDTFPIQPYSVVVLAVSPA